MFNNLLINDIEHKCPVTLSIETAIRVEVYKIGEGKQNREKKELL